MNTNSRIMVALGAGLLMLGGCKGFFEVENPGPIEDENLQSPDAIPSLVTGMSADYANVYDEMVRITGVSSDETNHGGSYAPEGLWVRGIIRAEDVNNHWANMHRARFEAQAGVQRIKAMTGTLGFNYDTSPLSARANLFAGLTNRLLGETVCEAVINNGPAMPNSAHFDTAEVYFTEAIRIAGTNTAAADIRNAALGGRAAVRAWKGNWAGAIADAALVPTNFIYYAIFSTNSGRENNSFVQETYVRREYSVFGTQWATVFNDPRVPWDTIKTATGAIQRGQDGRTNFFRQRKYVDLGADIPVVKGTEMLMLRAEERLRAATPDIAGAWVFVNQQRAFYGLPALAVPGTIAAAWTAFHRERGAVLWLEARRLWDLRRWNAETGPSHNAFLTGRSKCVPISQEEVFTNPNLASRRT